jgi:hypothetical protein
MSANYNLGDLRGAIEGVYREVISEQENGEASNAVVLARLKETRKPLIDLFAPQLKEMALTKLLNEVCKRSAARNSFGYEADLFGGYRKIPAKLTVARGLKRQTAKMKIVEFEEWLLDHSKPSAKEDYNEHHRLIADCKKYATSDQDTIEQALARKMENEKLQDNLGFV